MHKSNQSDKKPGELSLILIAFIIILYWQLSTLFTPTLGPIDALLVGLLQIGALLSSTFYSLIPFLIICGILIILTPILTSYGKGKWTWFRWEQKLAEFAESNDETTLQPTPIIGIEVTSLPLIRSLLDSPNMQEGFDLREAGYPYKYNHWAALHDELKELVFEVEIESSVSIRFWLPNKKGSRDELDMLCSSLQTSYGNLKFVNATSSSIPTIFGSSHTKAQLKEGTIAFKNEFASIIQIEGIPGPIFETTQLDSFIYAFTEREIRATLVVNFSSKKISPKKLETLNSMNIGHSQQGSVSSLQLNRQAPVFVKPGLGFWDVSAYLIVRSNDRKEHTPRVKSAQVILETIFHNPSHPITTKVLKGRRTKRSVLRVLYRKKLQKTALLSSQQLALLVHLPTSSIPRARYKNLAFRPLKSIIDLDHI